MIGAILSKAPADDVAKRAAEASLRRDREWADALHFLVYGEDEHAKRGCICDLPCSRDYDPLPYADAAPDARMYEGTGIGALYGLPGGEFHAWQLAGWNLVPGSTR